MSCRFRWVTQWDTKGWYPRVVSITLFSKIPVDMLEQMVWVSRRFYIFAVLYMLCKCRPRVVLRRRRVLVVVANSGGIGLVGIGTWPSRALNTDEKGVFGVRRRFNNHIGALADAKLEVCIWVGRKYITLGSVLDAPFRQFVLTLGLIRNDWHKVVCYHCHVVAVNREGLQCACAAIDDSKAVLLARRELETGEASIALARGHVARIDKATVEVVSTIDERVDAGGGLYSKVSAETTVPSTEVTSHATIEKLVLKRLSTTVV